MRRASLTGRGSCSTGLASHGTMFYMCRSRDSHVFQVLTFKKPLEIIGRHRKATENPRPRPPLLASLVFLLRRFRGTLLPTALPPTSNGTQLFEPLSAHVHAPLPQIPGALKPFCGPTIGCGARFFGRTAAYSAYQ